MAEMRLPERSEMIRYLIGVQDRYTEAQDARDAAVTRRLAAEARGDLLDAAAWSAEALIADQAVKIMGALAEAIRSDLDRLTGPEDRAE
jgi:hypothetical protein